MRQDRRSALPHRRPAGAPQRREYVVGYATTPGSRTEIWNCNGSPAQKWVSFTPPQ
ncbi:hypothetical protein H4687_004114 [Streptomyces stelliscabiei]|uniref:Uncharacterized protein n=1 Tax=Streptomyces stelliscabiei TaxID=146820 RepID=A0A8I0P497_9ACTN|nr:hypothetical protein [Streptomyces stelliscabiei]